MIYIYIYIYIYTHIHNQKSIAQKIIIILTENGMGSVEFLYAAPSDNFVIFMVEHSSEVRGLCLTKCPSEMLQNMPYFIYTKTQSCVFHFLFCATLFFPLISAIVYVDIDWGIH